MRKVSDLAKRAVLHRFSHNCRRTFAIHRDKCTIRICLFEQCFWQTCHACILLNDLCDKSINFRRNPPPVRRGPLQPGSDSHFCSDSNACIFAIYLIYYVAIHINATFEISVNKMCVGGLHVQHGQSHPVHPTCCDVRCIYKLYC